MKPSQQEPFARIVREIPEHRSMILYIRSVVITIIVSLIVVLFFYWIIGNRSPIIYSIMAVGSLLALTCFHWLVIVQINKSIDRAKRNENNLISREVTLHESEEKFRAFVRESSEGLVLTDEEGIVMEWNRSMEAITAIERKAALGKYVWELQLLLTLPEKRTEQAQKLTQSYIVEALHTGSSPITQKIMEVEIQKITGQRIIVEQSAFTIKSEKGYWIGSILRDISKRKQAERLQAVIYRISEAANTAPDLDELFRIIHTSINDLMPAKNFYIALYHPSEDLLYFPYHADEIEPDEDWPSIKPGKGLTNYVFRTGMPLLATPEIFDQLIQTGEMELIGKRAVDWLGVPLKTQHKKIGVMAVQTYHPDERLSESDKDILMFVSTQVAMAIERRQIEDALRSSQANLEDAQRMAHIGSWDWDLLTGEIKFSNEFYRMAGLEPGTITSLDILVPLIHPEERDRVLAILDKSLQENQPYNIDHRIIRQDGVELIIHSQAEIIYNDSGQPIRRVGALQDITEIRRVETEREKLIQELQSKNTELDRFTYTVSHDLRSPLVTIRGFLGFMQKDIEAGKTERVTEDMARIITAADKMQRFLDELLVLSRAGRVMNPPEPVSFNTIAVDTVEMLRGRIEARGVQVHIADDLPTILCDRTRLTQVVQNLVDNAIKFSGDQPNPKIEIGTEGKDSEGRAILYVRDNGIGIDPQFQENVFDLFNKVDSQTEGVGIGLTLVKRIIETHQGQVWLKSAGEGSGSIFFFSCPMPEDDVKHTNTKAGNLGLQA
jgi:PAS domain S-box-containing protein